MKRLLFVLPFLLIGLVPAPAPTQDKPAVPKHSTGYIPPAPAVKKKFHSDAAAKHGNLMALLAKRVTPPAEFDCKDLGWAGDPGDQAQCGSCYLYSTVKTATSAAVKAGLGKVDEFRLAPQFGMDCHDFGGCGGGNGTEVIDWMVKNGWYAEADPSQQNSLLYPLYQARSMSCRVPSGSKKYQPKSWMFATGDQGDHPATVLEIKAALMTFGRVNVALDAGGQFGNYSGGVITSLGNQIDHEINVRGWSDDKQALLLENQWSGWGGAKAPNDSCAWLSYKAVGSLQDPFTVLFDSPTPPPIPPVPPVPPVPPAPPVPPPVPPVPPAPPTPGTVVIPLTADQVASVNAQSGALVVSGSMTLQQLVDQVNKGSGLLAIDKNMSLQQLIDALNKAKSAAPCCPPKVPQPPASSPEPPQADKMKKLEDDIKQTREAIDAIMQALLKDKKP